jgi:hypothetical protein
MAGILDSSVTNLVSCTDSFGRPLGVTISPYGSNLNKFYSGTLSVGVSPLVIDIFTDLGRSGTKGYIVNNTSGTVFTYAVSIDGTTYGDEVTVRSTYAINFDHFIPFNYIRLTRVSDDVLYDLLVV